MLCLSATKVFLSASSGKRNPSSQSAGRGLWPLYYDKAMHRKQRIFHSKRQTEKKHHTCGRNPVYQSWLLYSVNRIYTSCILPASTPPLPCPSPPTVLPRGGGGRHLVNAHCVVVWVTVFRGTATCIPCTHGRTFCSLSLKWNLTAQPCFPWDKCNVHELHGGTCFGAGGWTFRAR